MTLDTGFEGFRQLVLDEPALQARLQGTTDRTAFPALVVGLGAERGFGFSEADVASAMNAAQRAWLERWIQ